MAEGERITMVRYGKRVSGTTAHEWWELPEGEDPNELRDAGYEVVAFVPEAALKEKERQHVIEADRLKRDLAEARSE